MSEEGLKPWQQFVVAYGRGVRAEDLAAVVQQPPEVVRHLRAQLVQSAPTKPLSFGQLFERWHGRAPTDAEWPLPRKRRNGHYNWEEPELALVAVLAGQHSPAQIAEILTARLKARTGDPEALRSRTTIQVCLGRLGLTTSDVLGGITTTQAAREIGSLAIVNQMIAKRQLKAVRRGRRWVIPYAVWEEWKAKRVFPPEGYVRLSTLKARLGIKSDKLSEYARAGYIPTAVRCNPFGTQGPSTAFGTWWIAPDVAQELVAGRKSGAPMPWHGKEVGNLAVTYKLWKVRQHPASCATCKEIWGKRGAPRTVEDYQARYPGLAHGEKRHLTRPWSPGLTIKEVAEASEQSPLDVKRAITAGFLAATTHEGRQYVSRTDATRWKARRCPTGDGRGSWIAIPTAMKLYLFTRRELNAFIARGELKTRVGTNGATRGILYVSRHQCGQLRQSIGFTEEQAAKRLGITVDRFRYVLEGVNWRKAPLIPLVTVQAVEKRLKSRCGWTLEEAAAELGKSIQWVKERIEEGVARVSCAPWDRRRGYLTEPMLRRLSEVATNTKPRKGRLGTDWLHLNDAALEAGVCTTTIIRWATADPERLERRQSETGWRYHREAVRARARNYWRTVRRHRVVPPTWLLEEQLNAGATLTEEPSRGPSQERRHRVAAKVIAPNRQSALGA